MWQMLVATAVGALFYVKKIWRFLAKRLGKWVRKE